MFDSKKPTASARVLYCSRSLADCWPQRGWMARMQKEECYVNAGVRLLVQTQK